MQGIIQMSDFGSNWKVLMKFGQRYLNQVLKQILVLIYESIVEFAVVHSGD
mgnify:CR=1 FL=1